MCKSKNDFPIAGYWGRLNQHSHCGQYDAMYKLINPDTTRPYLDLLSVRYSAARYLRMRRFSPFPAVLVPQGEEYCLRGFSNRPTWHQLHISNPTNHTITLALSADYRILASWYDSQKENNENEEQLGIPRVYMQAV